eukprot:NODE_4838_length_1012_cov_67.880765_g4631_i0.p1 GENE.NODE_4838_length_1012_cov_67.880765_g4631_i0~~NODE_4838_length_1012_cov_67.880765_g4631_i0.p1  ORF type:complete len:308 (+),score=35.59 NODE_4838_length_1012_cov_67.880765_g4631_i0:77-925(+)
MDELSRYISDVSQIGASMQLFLHDLPQVGGLHAHTTERMKVFMDSFARLEARAQFEAHQPATTPSLFTDFNSEVGRTGPPYKKAKRAEAACSLAKVRQTLKLKTTLSISDHLSGYIKLTARSIVAVIYFTSSQDQTTVGSIYNIQFYGIDELAEEENYAMGAPSRFLTFQRMSDRCQYMISRWPSDPTLLPDLLKRLLVAIQWYGIAMWKSPCKVCGSLLRQDTAKIDLPPTCISMSLSESHQPSFYHESCLEGSFAAGEDESLLKAVLRDAATKLALDLPT